jgi:oligopeptide transport system ATP-binding protein
METGRVADLFESPRHPYTQGLLKSIPDLSSGEHQRLSPIPGSPPDMLHPPAGCPFAPRCSHAMGICTEAAPQLYCAGDTPVLRAGQAARCWLHHPDAPEVAEVNAPEQGDAA